MNEIAMVALFLIIILVLHLIEEVRTGFRKRMLWGEMPLPVFAGINIFIYSFCLITFFLLLYGSPSGAGFAWVFAAGMLINGMSHLGMMAARRAYFPGGVTAMPLIPVAVYLMVLLVISY